MIDQDSFEKEVIERLARLETKIDNHLKHHDLVYAYFVLPLTVGVILIIAKVFGKV